MKLIVLILLAVALASCSETTTQDKDEMIRDLRRQVADQRRINSLSTESCRHSVLESERLEKEIKSIRDNDCQQIIWDETMSCDSTRYSVVCQTKENRTEYWNCSGHLFTRSTDGKFTPYRSK